MTTTERISASDAFAMDRQTDYAKYRGRCKEYAKEASALDPSLRVVRGTYWCPIWNSDESHWWCEKEDGTIVDPTKDQFPSRGNGEYTELDGTFSCANCNAKVVESEGCFESNYGFCSSVCFGRFVGLDMQDDLAAVMTARESAP